MRGKEYVLTLFQIFLRITPAYAGKRRFTILHELGH